MSDEPESDDEHVFKLRSERAFKVMPYLKEVFAIGDVIDAETDRGKVIASLNFLDTILKDLLLAFMVESRNSENLVKGEGAILSSFGARLRLAYSLGLISKNEFEELGHIQSIRNRFAHDTFASFDDEKIKGYVSKLKFFIPASDGTDMSPSDIFRSSASVIIFWLVERPMNIASWRRKRLEDTFKPGTVHM